MGACADNPAAPEEGRCSVLYAVSRRVVARYGFKEYARTYVYGWMPVMDMDVIRSLVPDE